MYSLAIFCHGHYVESGDSYFLLKYENYKIVKY
jgi:hypothetical protein